MEGKIIPSDKLTKLGSFQDHKLFRRNILGHDLIDFQDESDEVKVIS